MEPIAARLHAKTAKPKPQAPMSQSGRRLAVSAIGQTRRGEESSDPSSKEAPNSNIQLAFALCWSLELEVSLVLGARCFR